MNVPTQDTIGKVAPHTFAAKFVHWGFVGVLVYALTKQLDEVDELEDFALLQNEIVFAAVFLILLIARFVYMQSTRPTVLPSDTPKPMKLMARFVHLAMYASLSLIAVSGLVIGGLYWSGIKSGGAMESALFLHEIAVNASYGLIVGHVAAAIYHRRKRDGIWNSMVPVWKERRIFPRSLRQ